MDTSKGVLQSPTIQFHKYRLSIFMQLIFILCSLVFALAVPNTAMAHVSEQGLVLLLPTNVYITAGVLAVVLTVALLALTPAHTTHRIMQSRHIGRAPSCSTGRTISSLTSLIFLLVLIFLGFAGSRDPLKNPLPLYIWTFWWIGLVGVQGFIGNMWYWINPWSGLCKLLGIADITDTGKRLQAFGAWPALCIFLLFIIFALAYPAPDDPDVLAAVVLVYWFLTLVAMMFFGKKAWSRGGEFISIVMGFYSLMAVTQWANKRWTVGFPGHRAYTDCKQVVDLSMAVFVLVLLACGSFDGINETFWWLSTIGVNPLEFPGRSAIIGETIAGILIASVLLVLVFLFCVYLGLKLATEKNAPNSPKISQISTRRAFIELSVSILPIAFAYHLAHFLVTYLVNMQYLYAASSDPMSNGSNLLGMGDFYVTTGFLNTHHSVEFLWLAQAGIVVLGHILSVVMAHGIAIRLFTDSRKAVLSQIPLAVFMILYTFLGLWLLASPKGG